MSNNLAIDVQEACVNLRKYTHAFTYQTSQYHLAGKW